MKQVVDELRKVVREFSIRIIAIPEREFARKPTPEKWSKKEILGHLTDSAQNNLRRFICGQYESTPKIVYDQDFWVAANDYANAPMQTVLEGWQTSNESICRVLSTMPVDNYERTCDTSKNEQALRSLGWLAEDYIKHMKHHLNQIIPGSFDVEYP